MYYLVYARDITGRLGLRRATKAAHVSHLDAGDPAVRVLQTGPWLDKDGEEAGSLLILAADEQNEVEAFMARDPYVQAGLFEAMDIRPWKWSRGNPERQGRL
jgi:uncharacterized protein